MEGDGALAPYGYGPNQSDDIDYGDRPELICQRKKNARYCDDGAQDHYGKQDDGKDAFAPIAKVFEINLLRKECAA